MEILDTCFLCQKNDRVKLYNLANRPLADIYRIICPRCGMYKITEECYRYMKPQEDNYLLSGLVRELSELNKNDELEFLTTNIEKLKNNYPVPKSNDIEGKARKFLERLKEKTSFFGENIDFIYKDDYPLAYAKNEEEFKALLKFLNEKKLIYKKENSDTKGYLIGAKITLLADGWTLIGNLEPNNKTSEHGFVAAWFHESTDKSIDAIQEAITEAGYIPLCIRDEHFSEKIMDKALGEIRKSRFVIVDLTGSRHSVFFEAGFAFGLNIEVIYVYKESSDGSGLPPEFYVRHYQCYKYKNEVELKDILKDAISARIKKS